MTNKQTYPNSIFPLTGDVESQIGQDTVTVTGIQMTPFAPDPPQTGQVPVMGSDGSWHPEDPIVSGPDAVGTPPTVNPVQIAGIDEGNLVREIRTDSYGGLRLPRLEELMQSLIFELRANTAAILADKPNPDQDFVAANFTDSQVGA